MPESAGHYKPPLYFLSIPLTEEQEIDVSDMPFFHQQIRYTLYYPIIFSSTGPNTNRHGHLPQFPCGRLPFCQWPARHRQCMPEQTEQGS